MPFAPLARACVATALLGIASVNATAAPRAKPIAWGTDAKAAFAASKKTGKPVLAFFTGSDWCGFCIRLKSEVLDKPEFARWAAEHVILLELDFPQNKRLPAALAAQNQRLATQYGVQGYPSVLILDAQGKVHGQTGYSEGTPAQWIQATARLLPEMPKPPRLALAPTLAQARADAKQSGKPMLLALTTGEVETLEQSLDAIWTDEPFTEFAKDKLVAAHVKTGQNADEAQRREAQDWLKELGVQPKPFQLLFLSPEGGPEAVKVLTRVESRTTARALMQLLSAKLKPEESKGKGKDKAPAKP